MPKRSASAVAGTRSAVLDRAVLDASVEGLEGLTIGLLQPVKGAIIALQWALRMHGFDGKAETAAGQFFP